jgi:hypothetical protein
MELADPFGHVAGGVLLILGPVVLNGTSCRLALGADRVRQPPLCITPRRQGGLNCLLP